jgi:hypothetical protein
VVRIRRLRAYDTGEGGRFFYDLARSSLERADEFFGTAQNFTAGGGGGNLRKRIWLARVGDFKYHAYVLGGFDPIRADAIFDQPADVIAEAAVSKMCYEYVEPKGKQ